MWAKIKAWFAKHFGPAKDKIDTKLDEFTDAAKSRYHEVDDRVDTRIDEQTDKLKKRYNPFKQE